MGPGLRRGDGGSAGDGGNFIVHVHGTRCNIGNFHYCRRPPPMPSRAFPVLFASLLSTTSAHAQSWHPEPSGTSAELRGLSVVDTKVAWASGTRGTVLRTVD